MFTQLNKKLAKSLTLAVILALMVVGLALADVVLIDNDVADPGYQNTVDLSATPGATVSTSARIVISWKGTKHLKANYSINISPNPSGITLPSGYTVSSVDSTVPGDWNEPINHPDFFTVNSNIEFTAPTSPGFYTYYVRWTASGYTCATSPCLSSGGNPFMINLEVVNTPPTLNLPGDITAEATSPAGVVVDFTVTATDLEDDPDPTPICDPESGSTFPIGSTQVDCVVTDSGGLTGYGSFNVTVEDTTAPELTVPDDFKVPATSPAGATVTFSATATDLVDPDPVVTCEPASGSVFTPGTTLVNCTAIDDYGNTSAQTFSIWVVYQLYGFYQPVDMGDVWNVAKGGSTVPLKFEVFAGATELTDTAVVSSFVAAPVACPATDAVVAAIEITTTGVTSLRYDLAEGQFINNWQTPKKPGTCYEVTMTTQDGSTLAANFKLK